MFTTIKKKISKISAFFKSKKKVEKDIPPKEAEESTLDIKEKQVPFFKKIFSKATTLFKNKKKVEKDILPKEAEKSTLDIKEKQVPYKAQRQPGLVCPQCQNKIPVSILNLLQDSAVLCPYCNLELKIDQQQSQASLSKLKNFYSQYKEAEKMYKDAKKVG